MAITRKVSSGIEITEARGDDDVFSSSSFLGEYVSLEGCEFQTQDATNGLTIFFDEPCPKARLTFHYRNPSSQNPEPLQQSCGTTHKRIGSSQVTTKGPNKPQKALTTKGLKNTV